MYGGVIRLYKADLSLVLSNESPQVFRQQLMQCLRCVGRAMPSARRIYDRFFHFTVWYLLLALAYTKHR